MPDRGRMKANQSVVTFAANAVGTEEEAEWISAGVHNTFEPHYLLFERVVPIEGAEDWGIYIEYDDQANSGYDAIDACAVTRQFIQVTLTKAVDVEKRFRQIHVALQLDDT